MAPHGADKKAPPSYNKNDKKNRPTITNHDALMSFLTPQQQQQLASTHSTNILSQNKFAMLTDNESEDSDSDSYATMKSADSRKRSLVSSNKKNKKSCKEQPQELAQQKPPPLTVPSLPQSQARAFLADLQSETNKFEVRYTPDGTKIFASCIEAFHAVKQKLIDLKRPFFTHALRDEQTIKFILHGFYKVEVEELANLLAEMGINPIRVKNISVHNKRYDDHAVYLVHFLKSSKMQLATLRENVCVIDSVRVRWEFFRKFRVNDQGEKVSNGPIQCSNCMQYGHGGAHCFLNPLCKRCANSHRTGECPHLIDPQTNEVRARIPDEMVKCGLCGQNHPANYSKCSKRLEFINRQNIFRARTQPQRPQQQQQQQRQPNKQRTFTHAPQLANANFPSIHQNTAQGSAWVHTPIQPQVGFQRQPQVVDNNELFTTGELLQIMRELMGSLRTCRTKEQQIFAMSEIVIKYIYGST